MSETDEHGQGQDAIVLGQLDTTHQAVVAYLQGGKCSATIIDVVGNQGYALTAAHCISGNMGVLRQGDNHANGQYDVQYNVVDTEIHPLYGESNLYDFAMLRFSGANGSTPIIPALPKALDNIVQGTALDLVGYGQTENGGTTFRHHLVRPVSFETPLRLSFNQSAGGMCSGDSGGATLHDANNVEYVAGVNSFVSGGCTTAGTAVRVSAVYDTFITPYINNTAYLDQTCAECSDAHIFSGGCTQNVIDCFDNGSCSDYIDCIQGCSTSSCVTACGAQNPTGAAMYNGIFSCLCTGPCAIECSGDAQCQAPPACGLSHANAGCQTCYEAACCDQATACAGDAVCIDCVSSITPDASCESDPTVQAYTGCLEANCADACNAGTGGGGEGAGGEGMGGDGMGGTEGVGGGGVGGENSGGGDDNGEPFVVDGGCGCRMARPRSNHGLWLLFALAGGAIAHRRRER